MFDSYDSDGFTISYDASADLTNRNSQTYVAWNWKAGGSPMITPATALGNMTSNGGIAAAFDGDRHKSSYTGSARLDPSAGAFIGQDWGSGVTKTVRRFRMWAAADYAFPGNTGSKYYKLQGSTDNFSSSVVDLYTDASISTSNGATYDVTSGITTSTAYRYHRILFEGDANGGAVAQLEFYNEAANTDGSIKSAVSANTESGFSIVSYTGNGTSGATVGHGLGQAPELLIGKDRDATSSWPVFATPLGAGTALILDGNNSSGSSRGYDNALPSASVITLGGSGDSPGDWTALNTSGNDNVIYCFHSVEGYSKVGSYTGNGTNDDGPFAFCGFKPAYILIKDTSASEDWLIYDDKRPGYNVTDDSLEANDSAAENANGAIELDMLSNGFKIRAATADGRVNRNNDVYLFLAFAESPFKYSNAR